LAKCAPHVYQHLLDLSGRSEIKGESVVIINDNNGEKFTFSPRFRSREPGHGAAGDSGKLRFVQSEILSITPLIKPKLRKTIEL
jgi:hypothetical protein